MGWVHLYSGLRRDVIHEVTADQYTAEGVLHSKTLRYCLRGNNLWALTEYYFTGNKERHITLYMLRMGTGGDGWGWKTVEDSCGPNYYSCPKAYIRECSETSSIWANAWREAVLSG